MYVYGALTAPNPDRTAMRVTPITPTLLINCSMENMPANKSFVNIYVGYHKAVTIICTMFCTEHWKRVSKLPEEIEK
jgi:hypothetical protein